MNILKIIILVLFVAFVGIQFVPTVLNQSDVVPKIDFMLANDVPKAVMDKLQVSCYDCHSNNTRYPWYNKIQPVAWILEGHIEEGKKELNFNQWDSLSSRRKTSKLRSIIKQIENNEMPIYTYTLIHRDAILNDSDKSVIENYMNSLLVILE